MTPKEAAEKIGVSESLIYAWCRRELLPHYRLGVGGKGAKIIIEEEDLSSFLASCKVEESREVPRHLH